MTALLLYCLRDKSDHNALKQANTHSLWCGLVGLLYTVGTTGLMVMFSRENNTAVVSNQGNSKMTAI